MPQTASIWVMPAFLSIAISSLMPISSFASASTVIATELAKVPPPQIPGDNLVASVPPATSSVPVKSFTPTRVSVPAPDLTRLPAPVKLPK